MRQQRRTPHWPPTSDSCPPTPVSVRAAACVPLSAPLRSSVAFTVRVAVDSMFAAISDGAALHPDLGKPPRVRLCLCECLSPPAIPRVCVLSRVGLFRSECT